VYHESQKNCKELDKDKKTFEKRSSDVKFEKQELIDDPEVASHQNLSLNDSISANYDWVGQDDYENSYRNLRKASLGSMLSLDSSADVSYIKNSIYISKSKKKNTYLASTKVLSDSIIS
jgi:hypothetical protein